MDICQELNIPLIVHFHGFDAYHHGELQNSGKYYPNLFQKASATIAVSRHMEQQLLSLGAVKEKLYYNPYGVNLSLFQQCNPQQPPLTFITVGRFVDKKAPTLTILAFAQVCYQYPEAKLIMIGEGVLLESCKMLAKSLGIYENIEFTGSLPQSAVAEKNATSKGICATLRYRQLWRLRRYTQLSHRSICHWYSCNSNPTRRNQRCGYRGRNRLFSR